MTPAFVRFMNWPIIHLVFVTLLLSFHSSDLTHYDSSKIKKNQTIFLNHQKRIALVFKEKELAYLANALCLGNKKKVSSIHKLDLKRLNLLHLLTPSGLHLSSLLLLITPVLHFIKRKRKGLIILFDLCLISALYLLTSLHSAKRVALLRSFLSNFRHRKIPLYLLFLFTLLLDYLFGSYRASPLSFIYSGIFLGCFLAAEGRAKIVLILLLLLVQMTLSYFTAGPFYLMGALIGLLVTSFFTLIFPMIFIMYWLPFTYSLLEAVLRVSSNVLHFLSINAWHAGSLPVTLPIIIALTLLLLRKMSDRYYLIIVGALLVIITLTPNSIYNLPKQRVLAPSGGLITIEGLKEVKKTKYGFRWTDRYLRNCTVKLHLDGFRELCD